MDAEVVLRKPEPMAELYLFQPPGSRLQIISPCTHDHSACIAQTRAQTIFRLRRQLHRAAPRSLRGNSIISDASNIQVK